MNDNNTTNSGVSDKFLKPYDPLLTEEKIYKRWEGSGFFNPDNLPDHHKTPFTIIMPPPNANGRLHAGHALFITLEDIMIRYKRMQGYKALWVPGADHAGFETQIVYEKKLEKEGRSRFNMDRDQLFSEIMAFTLENKKYMEDDVRRVGASCDWSREKFTLDQDVINEVQNTFRKMYSDKLVYRGFRTVNWCAKHQTSLSDVETESMEKNDKLYFIKYGPFVVATVRPETIFADVAIAVNPNDERYKQYIGTEVEVVHPEKTIKLKVIADEEVDMEFGTGALKITPAHDHNDFRISEKHGLERPQTIDQYGKLTSLAGKYSGMKINEAREKVVEDLNSMGLIEKIEDYKHVVPVCYKCNTTIEPRLMPQWFVKMKPLAEMAMKAVNEEKVKFIPDNFRKIFMYWMENTIDWNISRQIVWGIEIPAKICENCNEGYLDNEEIVVCKNCGGNIKKDTDTFDTWFSSGQWPLLALGYPKSKDVDTYYPTDVMETGYDLIFKWIPRMVIFGLYLNKEVPFKTVYLHGLVNDAQGKKMSKSKGNVVSPIGIIDKFGADALRIGLVVGSTPGNDVNLSENKIKGYKNFANKIWNATRFVMTSIDGVSIPDKRPELSEKLDSQLEEFEKTIKDLTADMDNFRFHLASEKIYHYFWHTFADIIIEESKKALSGDDQTEKEATAWFLMYLLKTQLKLIHPFMPFITEEIWAEFKDEKEMLIINKWPS